MALRDVEDLVAPVVELEHQGITLAAVDARPRAEELDEIRSALGRHDPVTSQRLGYIPRAICRVVLLLVVGPAGSAVVVPLSARLTTPSELVERAELATTTAALQGVLCGLGTEHGRTYVRAGTGRIGVAKFADGT